MFSKKKWSGILPLSILFILIGGIFILGRIGRKQDEIVIERGAETTGVVFDVSKRMLRIVYSVQEKEYLTGVGKPYSYIKPGEEFFIKYLPQDPKSIVVFFDKPVFSKHYEYQETDCISITKALSVIRFQYEVDGNVINREMLYRKQIMESGNYIVRYRVSDPQIGYLIRNDEGL